jgi:general secretion pathway protein D
VPPSQTASVPASQSPTSPQTATFDFNDADIRAVIEAIAEAGHVNVVYGDIPPRKVSLHVQYPVGPDNAKKLLQSVARANGLQIFEDNDLVTISAVGSSGRRGDQSDGGSDPNNELFVYRLKHANATQLAPVLQAIFSTGNVTPAGNGITRQTLSQLLRQQSPFGGGGGGGGGRRFGGGGFGGGGGGNFSFSQSGQVGNSFGTNGQGGVFSRRGATGLNTVTSGQLSGNVVIVPEESSNSLLVRADPNDWAIVKQAIDAVDLRPLQVLIEVMIAEVSRTEDLDVGVGGSASNRRTSNGRTVGSAHLGVDTSSSNFIFDFTRYGAVDINLVLSALKSRGDVRILSLPLVFAQNNQESDLLVGSQRPFIQSFRTFATDNSATDQIIQYRDVGTSLAILPTINPDGYVNLQVQQEVSSATNEIQFGAPVISTREASASLFVKDGQTVVVGGLAGTQEEETRSGIPILSSIPGLGWLFRSTQKTKVRTELFLFLTPHIVQADSDVDRIRQQIQEKSQLLHTVPIEPMISGPTMSPQDTSASPVRPQQQPQDAPVQRSVPVVPPSSSTQGSPDDQSRSN